MVKNKTKNRLTLENGISLIIPILNEERTVAKVIDRCANQFVVSQLILVNDGSTDTTKSILEKIKKDFSKNKDLPLLTVVHHEVNKGKGAAIKTGLTKVEGKYVMVQDADLEYDPEDISKLFERAEKSKDGIVFGTRSHNRRKGYLLAQLGNLYLNVMFNLLYDFKLTDVYTCYKLIPNKIWQELDLVSNGFELDSELVAKLGKKKYQIFEVPISYSPRTYKEGKKIKWTDLIKATVAALKVKFNKPII